MRVCEISRILSGHSAHLTARIDHPTGGAAEVYFRFEGLPVEALADNADPFAAAALLPAMRVGTPLTLESPISQRLRFQLPRIRDVFATWWPQMQRIEIEAPVTVEIPTAAERGGATFFSGGVDSFYTLHKYQAGCRNPNGLRAVVFMRGIETLLRTQVDVGTTEQWIRNVASATGVQAVIGETNIRKTLQGSKANLHWERHYHGSALAAVALSLSGQFSFVCIPSAFSYNHIVAHGSNPLTDEMYSTERLQIVHDGGESTRARKIASILAWNRDLVLRYLRVCFMNQGGAFNCGRCYKCVRTAVPLMVLGAWGEAANFRVKTWDHWEDVMARDHAELTLENLRFAEERGAPLALIRILKRAIRRRRRRDRIRSLLDRPGYGLLKRAAVSHGSRRAQNKP